MMETARGRHRVRVENDMIRRREKAFESDQMWGGATKYYEHFSKVNAKYEEWSSPRYYEESMKQYQEMRTKRDKEESLVKRREKLLKLYRDEESAWEVEMMVNRNKPVVTKEEVPNEVLKEISDSFKEAEEIKRKQEAEHKLYQHWRLNNPVVRSYERAYNVRNVKLSWLDQQIEKRMQKEREEEEAKRVLKERDILLKKEREKEEERKKEVEEKNRLYKEMLDRQVQELKQKQVLQDELKRLEEEEVRIKMKIVEIEEKYVQEERRRLERECALFNVRQHKLKLKQKAKDVLENLAVENELILRLKQLEMERIVGDRCKRAEVQRNFEDYMKLVQRQKELEMERQTKLDFIFDSEARMIFERQNELWKNEEQARRNLLKEVLDTVKLQVEENLEKNKEKQRQLLREREEETAKMEIYQKELELLKRENEKKQVSRRRDLEESVAVKNARKVQEECIKLKELDEELERIRREEERLKNEIMNIQRRKGGISRHKFF